MAPSVFVSYSHDNEDHRAWVLQLATRLRHNGVDTILDRWNLDLGKDVAAFIERGLSESNRVLCICSENYVRKANLKVGGVGYEKRIMTAEIMADLDTDWVIPVIRDNAGKDLVPTFFGGVASMWIFGMTESMKKNTKNCFDRYWMSPFYRFPQSVTIRLKR